MCPCIHFLYFRMSLKIQKSTHSEVSKQNNPNSWNGLAQLLNAQVASRYASEVVCTWDSLLDHQHFTTEKCDPDNVSRCGPTQTLICHISKNRHSGTFGILRNMYLQELGPFQHTIRIQHDNLSGMRKTPLNTGPCEADSWPFCVFKICYGEGST